jgi:hypothetical protein
MANPFSDIGCSRRIGTHTLGRLVGPVNPGPEQLHRIVSNWEKNTSRNKNVVQKRLTGLF